MINKFVNKVINRTKLSFEKKRLLLFRTCFDESLSKKITFQNYIHPSIKSLKRRKKEKDNHRGTKQKKRNNPAIFHSVRCSLRPQHL